MKQFRYTHHFYYVDMKITHTCIFTIPLLYSYRDTCIYKMLWQCCPGGREGRKDVDRPLGRRAWMPGHYPHALTANMITVQSQTGLGPPLFSHGWMVLMPRESLAAWELLGRGSHHLQGWSYWWVAHAPVNRYTCRPMTGLWSSSVGTK